VSETSVDPLRIENVVEEKSVKAEQPPSVKEVKRGRKRKSQVRFSPSPTREETAHHADVEDNIAFPDTPRRRTVRPSKVLDMVTRMSPAKSMLTPVLQPIKREERLNKRKRSESLGNQSSDGAAETVEVPNDKKSKPEPVGKVGKVGGVRHSVAKEETVGKSSNMKVSKAQTEENFKTKSNVKQQTVGENTQKVIGANRHNTRHQREASPSEPEVKRSKRHELDGVTRSTGRRSSSREMRSATNNTAGESDFNFTFYNASFHFPVLKIV
jgi:hypothetical protein